MKRFVALCLMAVALATAPAFSDGLDRGLDAYRNNDYKTAVQEFHPLAEQGNALAQYMLGDMYIDGEGVPHDYKQTVKWYRLSAEQGYEAAQNALGSMYYHGNGVLQDYVLAHMWYNISASNGAFGGKGNRDFIEEKMTPAQIEKAQDLARACVAKDYKGC